MADNDSFQSFIDQSRVRKESERLANSVFGSSDKRRKSAPSSFRMDTFGSPSLSSRAGVQKKKPTTTSASRPQNTRLDPSTSTDSETNMAIDTTTTQSKRGPRRQHSFGPDVPTGPRAALKGTKKTAQARAAQLAHAMLSSLAHDSPATVSDSQFDPSTFGSGAASPAIPSPPAPVAPIDEPQQQQQQHMSGNPLATGGMSIRGIAGPARILAQNFAPGTTAADIEHAMTPHGGAMLRCRVVKTKPIMVVYMEFETKEGGDNVIKTFDNQNCDGRLIRVYRDPNPPGDSYGDGDVPAPAPASSAAARTLNHSDRSHFVDGSLGFGTAYGEAPDSNGLLYSDTLLAESRRGRGFRQHGYIR